MELIILPNQLFPGISKKFPEVRTLILIEEPRYFTDFRFHKLKLIYHRASMKKYAYDMKDYKIIYINYDKIDYSRLNKPSVLYFNPIDHKLLAKLANVIPKATMVDNMGWLLSSSEIARYKNEFYNKEKHKYSFVKWHIMQRQRWGILIEENGKPTGGKWSFDSENRKKLPKGQQLLDMPILNNEYYDEAISYINANFPDNYGQISTLYPIDTQGAKRHFRAFLRDKLEHFGKYEDAISTKNHFLFHSVISPMMGIGLLTEEMIIKMTLQHKPVVPLASLEGFIRQILGWRGYCYAIYLLEPDMYSMNHFGHHGKINDKYWSGIGILPVDNCIASMHHCAYVHHIERLMILGNWFLINRKDPKEVYRIFMEWSIDGYDWVMTPNVMGMSQHADGGMMMTRPYFSSSAYILRMSDYSRNGWEHIWDAKYYSFIADNIDMLRKNYATAMQARHYSNKTQAEKEEFKKIDASYVI
jgi:deoxyribodipyrimidine photolyase-related protein